MRRRNPTPARRCGNPTAARRDPREWFGRSLGRRLLEADVEALSSVLPTLFGYHLLQAGQPAAADLLQTSRIRHRVVLDELPTDPENAAVSLVGAVPQALPVASDSLDVVVLPHTLEYTRDPHGVLREADRCLIPEGHVVILGFNPWSLWGMWRLFLHRRGAAPWCGQFYSLTRLKDWLALLGFDTVLVRTHFFRPPLKRDSLMGRLSFLERAGRRWWPRLGGGYLLVAKKRVVTLTPIRPRWRPRRGLVGGLTEPTLRRCRMKRT